MPVAVGPLVDTVLRRVRDQQGSATSRDLVRWLLSLVQQVVNAGVGQVLDTASFVTHPLQQVYPLAEYVPTACRVIGVREGNRDLAPIPFSELAEVDRKWHRRTGSRYEVFAPIGRDLFVVHPGTTTTSTLTVVSVKLTDSLTFDSDIVEMRNDDIPLMLDLTETLLLMKMRLYPAASAVASRIKAQFEGSKSE